MFGRKARDDKGREPELSYTEAMLRLPFPQQSLNEKGEILDVNDEWLKTLGYSRAEVIGRSFTDFLADEYRPSFAKKFELFKQKGTVRKVVFKMRRKDGSDMAVEYFGTILRDKDDRFVHTRCAFIDMTSEEVIKECLENSEVRYRNIMQQTPRGIMVFTLRDDGELVLTESNPAADVILGVELESLHGMTLKDAFPPLANTEVEKAYVKAAKDGSIAIFDSVPYQHGDISGHYEVQAYRISPLTVVVSFTDISERIRDKERLEKEREKFQRVFETSNDAVMLLDSEKFFDANDATIRLFGYSSREEFLGKHPGEVSPPVQPDGTPSKDAADERIGKALREGKNFFEWTHRRADGTDFAATVLLTPLELEGRQVLQATVRDITEEKALQQKHRAVVEGSPDGMIFVRRERGELFIDDYNPATERILGIKFDAFVGKKLGDVFPAREGSKLEAEVLDALHSGKEITMRDVSYEVQGNRRHYTFSVYGATLDISVIIFRDVTETVDARQKLVALDRLKTRFITALSHATKQPLSRIRWSMESIRSGQFGDVTEEEAALIKQALDSEEEVVQVIENMNLTLEIERGGLSMNRMPTSMVSLVKSVKQQFADLTEKDDIDWKEDIDKSSFGIVEIDSDRFRIALNAVFDNAVRYRADESPSITVRAVRKDSRIRIEVQDNGIGIPASEKGFIFERFYRGSNAQTKHTDGMGLGLYIARSIVQEHGGDIGFDSKEGEGTTFWIEVPLSEQD